jgi:hypothetical protein
MAGDLLPLNVLARQAHPTFLPDDVRLTVAAAGTHSPGLLPSAGRRGDPDPTPGEEHLARVWLLQVGPPLACLKERS